MKKARLGEQHGEKHPVPRLALIPWLGLSLLRRRACGRTRNGAYCLLITKVGSSRRAAEQRQRHNFCLFAQTGRSRAINHGARRVQTAERAAYILRLAKPERRWRHN